MAGISQFSSDINAAGVSYLNGDMIVLGRTILNTTANNDVSISDAAGADIMRIGDAGDITLQKASVVLTANPLGYNGLYLNNLLNETIALFKANRDVVFYGTNFNALHINASNGLAVTAGSNGLTVGTLNTTIAGATVVSGTLSCGALTASGTVSIPGSLFCAGYVGATGTKITSTGQVSYTVTRQPTYPAGVWVITFASAHPLGANYIVQFSAQGGNSWISPGTGAPTSTRFICATYQMATTTLIDIPFYFMVLAS